MMQWLLTTMAAVQTLSTLPPEIEEPRCIYLTLVRGEATPETVEQTCSRRFQWSQTQSQRATRIAGAIYHMQSAIEDLESRGVDVGLLNPTYDSIALADRERLANPSTEPEHVSWAVSTLERHSAEHGLQIRVPSLLRYFIYRAAVDYESRLLLAE